jgi:ferredoxin
MKNSDVTIIYADGSTEIRPAKSFKKRPTVRNGRCTKCGQPVRWRKIGKEQRLLDRGGYAGQEHACPEDAKRRPLDHGFSVPAPNRLGSAST